MFTLNALGQIIHDEKCLQAYGGDIAGNNYIEMVECNDFATWQ
jgi:hypothetical protein